jgi:hypothetical protein
MPPDLHHPSHVTEPLAELAVSRVWFAAALAPSLSHLNRNGTIAEWDRDDGAEAGEQAHTGAEQRRCTP